MQFFSKVLSKDLFFFLIQYLQMTCDSNTQCDAIFLENTSYRPVLFPNSILAEDMRQPYSVWCNNSRKKLTYLLFLLLQFLHRKCKQHTQQCDAFFLRSSFYRPVLFPNSIPTDDIRRQYSVWCNITQKSLTNLSFLLLQFLQRTCERHTQCDAFFLENISYRPVLFLIQNLQMTYDGNTQCDAITLEKSLTYLLFLLLQFLQRKCEQHTQCDAFFLRSSFCRPVLFDKSVLTVDMRGPYSVWCNNSRKKGLHTRCFSYFSLYRGHANAILSVMRFFSKVFLQTCSFS